MSPTGPLYPTVSVDGGGAKTWANVNNALVEDGAVATCATVGPGGGGGVPNQLKITGFGFNLPTFATIDGIKLEIKVSTTGGNNGNDAGYIYLLYNGGSTPTASTPNSGQFWSASGLTWNSYGSSTSLWGKAWTASDINNANFGASIAAMPGTGTADINVDSVRITVYWHVTPIDVPKRYQYMIYSSGGTYLGNLPNVISEFGYSLDINTAGTQLSIQCAQTGDVSTSGVDTLTDEAGTTLTDEASANLSNEGQIPLFKPGNASGTALIKNGNRLVVWEASYYWPNGQIIFQGEINRWEANFGGENEQDVVDIMAYSDGQELDNYLVRGYPYTYTNDNVQTSQNASVVISASAGNNGWNQYGQTFKTGGAITNIGAISVYLNGTAHVIVELYDSPALVHQLGVSDQSVSVSVPTEVQFAFPNPGIVTANNNYFFLVRVQESQSITIYYSNANPYANGIMYNSNYGGGSGGGAWLPVTGSDLYFKTSSGTGSTTATFTSLDAGGTILPVIMADYISRGGLIALGSYNASGLVTLTFNTNTVLEALRTLLSVAPAGYYFYVDPGTSKLNFPQSFTTADFVLTKGKHLLNLKIISSIENIKNQVYFTGGPTAGVNLYKTYSDSVSIDNYGIRLERKTDNRVTVNATADAIGLSEIAEMKDELYHTTLTILDKTMDITLLKPGKLIGFNGFGSFVDNLLAQVVRIDYSPSKVILTLGTIPKRLVPEFEKVTRGLVAEQTLLNPSAPS